MSISLKLRSFLLPISLILIFSCGRSTKDSTAFDPAYSAYISGHTTGVVSAGTTIEVHFANPPKNALKGKEIKDKKLLTFSPDISGTLFWKDAYTMSFLPDKPLPQGKAFTAVLNLNQIFSVPDELTEYVFDFAIIPQFVSLGTHRNIPYPGDQLGYSKLTGEFRSADVIAEEYLEKIFEVSLNGKKITPHWSSKGTIHEFRLDSIVRDKNDQDLAFKLNGKIAGFDQKESFELVIPSIDNFQVTHVRWNNESNGKISVTFSDPIDQTSVVRGLVTLDNRDDIRLQVEGAMLHIYPSGRPTGKKELFLHQNIKSVYGYPMKKEVSRTITFESQKPAVEFLSEGTIIPDSEGLKVPFRAVNLRAVDVVVLKIFERNVPQFLQVNQLDGNRELKRVARPVYEKRMELTATGAVDTWQTYALDLDKMISADPGAMYRVELHFRQSYSAYPCEGAESFEGDASTRNTDNYDQNANRYYSYWNQPDYSWQERDNPCHPTYYYETSNTASKNVMASNIGLTLKANDQGKYTAVVTDLRTAKPLSGVKVELFNLQHQSLAQGNSQNNGLVNFTTDKTPYLAVASRGKEKTYLRVDDGSSLSLSAFDVGGSRVHEGLKGFIYGERGIWRPGDTLFLNFILEDEANPLPKGHPIVFTLQNPHGQIVDRQSLNTPGKIFPFTTKTSVDAPTGYYVAKVKIGGAEFTRSLRIETVKPNRLRIQLKPDSADILTVKNPGFNVSSEWLTGASAAGYRTVVEMEIRKGNGRFSEFPGFIFQDKVGNFYPNHQPDVDQKLDDKGNLYVRPNIGGNRNLPGMLAVDVFTRVFEPGGDFSINRSTLNYAPYDAFVGIKVPKSRETPWLNTGVNHSIAVASVNPSGKKISRNLSYEVYHINWSWWYNRSGGQGFYLNDRHLTRVDQGTVRTRNGLGQFDMRIDEPQWGNFLVRVCDDESGHCTAERVYIDWPMSAQRSRKAGSGPAMLSFWADKEKYEVGDRATINIPSSKDANMFISIETGGDIIQTQWLRGEGDFTVFNLDITKEMAPNIYIYISQLQPHGQTANDIPIRTYGVLPLEVGDPKTVLQPVIDMKEELKPEKPFTVKVSETNGRPMTYTLAIVDEGLLDLTNFRTPNPHQHFYSKEALGIRTWDMYDHVVNAYGQKIEQLMAVGGGDDLSGSKPKSNLRFVPVVRCIGPITLKAGASNTHEFTMPNYVGSVRAMVVAAEQTAYGHVEKQVTVKLPLMAQTTLPRVLGPKDKISIPVQLFAMESGVKEVTVQAKIKGDAKLTVGSAKATFSEPGEKMVMLEMEVGESTGLVVVEVEAKSGAIVARDKTTLEVRYPNRPQTVSKWTRIDPGKSEKLQLDAIGMKKSNSALVEVSGMPDINLYKRLESLITYPHGCLEQSISRVFPQIFLNRFTDLTEDENERITEQVNEMLMRLIQLQAGSGGMRFWPGSNYTHDWGSSYALHFLVEAEKQGYSVPTGLKANLIRYQADKARRYDSQGERHYQHYAQAYRLYGLALAGSPELGAMNRMRSLVRGTGHAANLLAAAYMLSGQKSAANELYDKVVFKGNFYRDHYTFGSTIRDQAVMLESVLLLEREEDAVKLVEKLTGYLASDRWMSTQEISWSLCALARYYKGIDIHEPFNGELLIDGSRSEKVSGKGTRISREIGDAKSYSVELKNTGNAPIYLRLSNTGIPVMGEEMEMAQNLNLSVTYLNNKRETISVDKLPQGTDFIARVTVQRSGVVSDLRDLVLSQVFPPGWEIISTRASEYEDQGDYQDYRDDRVYTYFDINHTGSRTFEIRLNATYRGTYYLPPIMVEGMYSDEAGALKRGRIVSVE
ncbi:MAG: hypothetical protein JJU02_11205 [Cryomorphaceae bacterium]|nr:hypothetical protein [Cryomorphaceae bacterium]